MKKFLNSFLIAFIGVFIFALTGCGSTDTSLNYEDHEIVPLYIFNVKGENAVQFEDLAKAYEAETGIPVHVFSIGAGQEHASTLRTEMRSQNPPAIFSLQGIKELPEWVEGDFILDLNTVDNHPEFRALVDSIPQEMRLTQDGIGNLGIPYNVEGYGYIVDTQMLEDLFEITDVDALLEDIRLATYEEWEALVLAIDEYIDNPSAKTVVLNNTEYTFRAEKTGLAQNLTGVFAVMGAESWTYSDHFVNISLNAAFSHPLYADQITPEELDDLHDIFVMYASALDFQTSHMAGQSGRVNRGPDFVSSANFGYDQVIHLFTEGRAVFMQQGNWAETNIRNADPEVAERITFLPVKIPVTQDLILAEGVSVEDINTSIPVFVPMYYVINSTVSEEEQLMAMDFLVWLNTSETGRRFVEEEFLFIPFNVDPTTVNLPSPLANSIIDYMNKDATLAAIWHGVPGPWGTDVFGNTLMERFMILPDWTEETYNEIADLAISSWRGLIN